MQCGYFKPWCSARVSLKIIFIRCRKLSEFTFLSSTQLIITCRFNQNTYKSIYVTLLNFGVSQSFHQGPILFKFFSFASYHTFCKNNNKFYYAAVFNVDALCFKDLVFGVPQGFHQEPILLGSVRCFAF